MRIALDATPLSVPHSGIGRYTRELIAHLPQVRPDAEILTFTDPNVTGGGSALDRRWWSWGLPRSLRQAQARLFHGTDFAVPILGQTPAVLTIHDLSPLQAREWKMPPSAKRIARRLPRMIVRAKVVLTPSERIRQEVLDRFRPPPTKVLVTPLAASAVFQPPSERCPLPKPAHPPCLLFVGKREPRKNVIRLLRALAASSKLREQSLVMAGPAGPEEPLIQATIAALGLQSRVWLTGPCSDETLAGLYSHARLVVYPSLYEGFGLPVLEAMACGAPVLTSRDTACAEVAGGAACLVDPLNEEELAAGMEAVLTDSDLAAALRRKSLERAQQFSWQKTAELTWQAYEIALSGG
jgi:glycosyltransferase involved in cell wall biosynthesis